MERKMQVETKKNAPTLQYLFFTFLKIGAVSFGGHMALISIVKNVMVDKDKVIHNDTILEATSIGSILPGPMAVNIVTYIGFLLKGISGAIISMIAVLLPAVILMIGLAWAYFTVGFNQQAGHLLIYINAVVVAIILSTAIQLYTKAKAGNLIQNLLVLIGIATSAFSNNFYIILGLLAVGGLCGYLFHPQNIKTAIEKVRYRPAPRPIIITFVVLLSLFLIFVTGVYKEVDWLPLKMFLTFSGISLSLFGGGYVMIPIMQSLFVDGMQWISQQEFRDAITFSQVTPGPILVSATFIGYKLLGLPGALIATIAIFAPSATLMLLVSRIYESIKHTHYIQQIVSGIKFTVIGMIAGSAIRLGWNLPWNASLIILFVISIALTGFYKISPVYLIAGAIIYVVVYTYFS